MRNPFAGRPPLSILQIFLISASVSATAATLLFLANSGSLAIAALILSVAAFAFAFPAFKAFRALGDLYEHQDVDAMRRAIKIYSGYSVAVMIALLTVYIIHRLGSGHRYEQMPWWFFYILTMTMNPMRFQLRPPAPPRTNTWRAELKPLTSDHWGQS